MIAQADTNIGVYFVQSDERTEEAEKICKRKVHVAEQQAMNAEMTAEK